MCCVYLQPERPLWAAPHGHPAGSVSLVRVCVAFRDIGISLNPSPLLILLLLLVGSDEDAVQSGGRFEPTRAAKPSPPPAEPFQRSSRAPSGSWWKSRRYRRHFRHPAWHTQD